MSFGDYFRKLRKSKDVTQKQIAEVIGKTTMLVSGVETNKNNPFTSSDLNKIAKFLNLSNDERRELEKEAAKERGLLPAYMLTYFSNYDEAYQLLDVCVDKKIGRDSLQQIIKYAEELGNV